MQRLHWSIKTVLFLIFWPLRNDFWSWIRLHPMRHTSAMIFELNFIVVHVQRAFDILGLIFDFDSARIKTKVARCIQLPYLFPPAQRTTLIKNCISSVIMIIFNDRTEHKTFPFDFFFSTDIKCNGKSGFSFVFLISLTHVHSDISTWLCSAIDWRARAWCDVGVLCTFRIVLNSAWSALWEAIEVHSVLDRVSDTAHTHTHSKARENTFHFLWVYQSAAQNVALSFSGYNNI